MSDTSELCHVQMFVMALCRHVTFIRLDQPCIDSILGRIGKLRSQEYVAIVIEHTVGRIDPGLFPFSAKHDVDILHHALFEWAIMVNPSLSWREARLLDHETDASFRFCRDMDRFVAVRNKGRQSLLELERKARAAGDDVDHAIALECIPELVELLAEIADEPESRRTAIGCMSGFARCIILCGW